MSGTSTNNDIIIDEATRFETAELAEEVAETRSYVNFFQKLPNIIEQTVAVGHERMNADLNRRGDLSPDEKREHQEAWARWADFMKENFTNGIPPLEQQKQCEAVLARAEAVLAARAAGFIFGDNNRTITNNMQRLRDTMASPGIVNENVTAFIKPMIATLKRDDLSPKVKQMLKKEWVLLFNDYHEGLTNAIRTSEQEESTGIAEKRAAAVAAIADIEKADTAVVGRDEDSVDWFGVMRIVLVLMLLYFLLRFMSEYYDDEML